MKVVSAQAMAELEAKTYQQGYAEIDFMEKAGQGIALRAQEFIVHHQLDKKIWLLCGKGNNAGDAFVAGCHLLEQGYQVIAIQPESLDHCSPLCQKNGRRFLDKHGVILSNFPSLDNSGIILDGLFGTGFKGQIRAPYDSIIKAANQSGLPILAIDIPSGLNGTSGQVEGSVIQATETIFLGLPKTGFFLEEGWNVVGKLHGVDFGLPKPIVDEFSTDIELLTLDQVSILVPPIKRNRHKYQAGYVVGLAGSPTMPGAALLSSLAAFRGGSGLVRLLYPNGMENTLSASPYELIKISYAYDQIDNILQLTEKAGAIYIGPGLGRGLEINNFLQKFIPHLKIPCVMDADALALFADRPYQLPSQVVFTPHMGEMQTLLKKSDHLSLNFDLLKICQNYAEEHNLTLVLKGAPTFIFHPGKAISVNPTGDPGMATAGSGDVLTGLIASLLSQKLSTHHAAQLGVYLHGLSGECAAKQRRTSHGMMATDLVEHFAEAYHLICAR